MKLSLIGLGVILSLIACSSAHSPRGNGMYTEHAGPVGNTPEVVPVYIDKRFTDKHRAAIHESFAQWNIALNGYESFTIVSDTFDMEPNIIQDVVASGQGLLVLRRATTDSIMEDLPEGVLGWVMMEDGYESHVLNLVEDAIGNRDITSIANHEIGHTLRLPHLPVKGTTMYPSYRNGSPCLDMFTMQTLATIRGWDWHLTNFCSYPL